MVQDAAQMNLKGGETDPTNLHRNRTGWAYDNTIGDHFGYGMWGVGQNGAEHIC